MKKILTFVVCALMLLSLSFSVFAQSEAETQDVDIEKGREYWNRFLRSLELVKDDPNIFSEYSFEVHYDDADCARVYEKTLGRDASEWEKLAPFEKLLWYFSWMHPQRFEAPSKKPYNEWAGMVIKNTRFDRLFSDYYFTVEDNQIIYESRNAYLTLIKWDYEYYNAYGEYYNFVDNFGTEVVEDVSSEDVASDEVSETVTSENDGEYSEISEASEGSEASVDEPKNNKMLPWLIGAGCSVLIAIGIFLLIRKNR